MEHIISIEESLKRLISNLRKVLPQLMVLLLIVCCSIRCSKPKEKNNHSEEMQEALIFLIDSMLYKAHGDNFLISPKFFKELRKENIKGLITDSILRKEDLHSMAKQYTKYKEMKLGNYINEEYDSIITKNQPNKDQFYYVISPPLFSSDKKFLLFYVKAFFKVNKKYRWDEMFFLFGKEKNHWKFLGYPSSKGLQHDK